MVADHTLLIGDRLDRLPAKSFAYKLALICGLVWLIESYDVGVVGVTLIPLSNFFHLTAAQKGIFASSANIGIVLGCASAGALADRYGRKTILLWSTVWFSLASLLAAFAINFPAILVLRGLAGLGMGAAFTMPYAVISEFVPKTHRTRLSGMADGLNSVGYFVAPALGFFLVPHLAPSISWRILFAIGGLGALYGIVIYRYVPESPRWLYARGLVRQADDVLAELEARTGVRRGAALDERSARTLASAADTPGRLGWHELFKGRLLRTSLMFLVAFTSCNLFALSIISFMPQVLVSRGFAVASSFAFTALIQAAPIPGKLLNGYLSDRFGRKYTLVGFMLVGALAITLFGSLTSPVAVAVYGFAMTFFGVGLFGSIKVYWSEQYPTALRGRGSGMIESVGRFLGSVVGLSFVPLAFRELGVALTFTMLAAFLLIGALAIAIFGKETKDLSLEEISSDYAAPQRRLRSI